MMMNDSFKNVRVGDLFLRKDSRLYNFVLSEVDGLGKFKILVVDEDGSREKIDWRAHWWEIDDWIHYPRRDP